MHVDEGKVNNYTFAPALKQAGYTVGMFGKYLNECPGTPPIGWDVWLANGGGNYFNPEFAVKNVDGLPDSSNSKHFPLGANYTTSVVGNYSIEWINKVAGKGQPFFAYIAPKAAHDPFQPAPWYADYWASGWPLTAPRPPSWNLTSAQLANHHPNVANQAVLTESVAECIDTSFKNRWRTLMSVDDVVGAVFAATKRLGVHDNTFYIYSSDHGFQLGELNLPQDKRTMLVFEQTFSIEEYCWIPRLLWLEASMREIQ
jgi:N-acetylglucosamine-6-sulfatase